MRGRRVGTKDALRGAPGAPAARRKLAEKILRRAGKLYPDVVKWMDDFGNMSAAAGANVDSTIRQRWLNAIDKGIKHGLTEEKLYHRVVGWMHGWQMTLTEVKVGRVRIALEGRGKPKDD